MDQVVDGARAQGAAGPLGLVDRGGLGAFGSDADAIAGWRRERGTLTSAPRSWLALSSHGYIVSISKWK